MKTYMSKDLFQIYMNNLALSIINCLSIWNLFMIIWKVLCSIGNCYCWLYFLYYPKLTYPMLVDISFLKFISCCTFSILWGNDDTIESAFSLYSLSNIVTHTRQIIWIFWSTIVHCHSTIVNCHITVVNCHIAFVNFLSTIINSSLLSVDS